MIRARDKDAEFSLVTHTNPTDEEAIYFYFSILSETTNRFFRVDLYPVVLMLVNWLAGILAGLLYVVVNSRKSTTVLFSRVRQ